MVFGESTISLKGLQFLVIFFTVLASFFLKILTSSSPNFQIIIGFDYQTYEYIEFLQGS